MYIILYKDHLGEVGATKIKASHIIEAAQFFTKNCKEFEILQISVCN